MHVKPQNRKDTNSPGQGPNTEEIFIYELVSEKEPFPRELGLGFRAFSEVTSETVDDRGGV